jgi:hypothetical protein
LSLLDLTADDFREKGAEGGLGSHELHTPVQEPDMGGLHNHRKPLDRRSVATVARQPHREAKKSLSFASEAFIQIVANAFGLGRQLGLAIGNG